jgi:hypothetical protein
MPSTRRFPPPWTIDEANDACFIVRDKNGQALGYFNFEDGARRLNCSRAADSPTSCLTHSTERTK